MQQICFIKQDYDRTVKPFWNDTCKNLSDNLFLPYDDNKKPNFTIHYLSSLKEAEPPFLILNTDNF